MAKIELAAFDVDGTLTEGGAISPAVEEAIQALRHTGAQVVIATGRTLSEVRFLRERWPWLRYYILSNGACIFDGVKKDWIYAELLPPDLARAVYGALGEMDVMPELYSDGTVYTQSDQWANAARYIPSRLIANLAGSRETVADFRAFLAARSLGVEKVNLFFRDTARVEEAYGRCILPGVALVVSAHRSLEANKAGCSKGKALGYLCGLLGVDPFRAAALGDGIADISMLDQVGLAIAMGNAVEAVKAHARAVAPACAAGGAAYAIRHYILKEGEIAQ